MEGGAISETGSEEVMISPSSRRAKEFDVGMIGISIEDVLAIKDPIERAIPSITAGCQNSRGSPGRRTQIGAWVMDSVSGCVQARDSLVLNKSSLLEAFLTVTALHLQFTELILYSRSLSLTALLLQFTELQDLLKTSLFMTSIGNRRFQVGGPLKKDVFKTRVRTGYIPTGAGYVTGIVFRTRNIPCPCGQQCIRLKKYDPKLFVANKLYPLSYISQNIEEFATKMMLSVADGLQTADSMDIGELKMIGREAVQRHIPLLIRTIVLPGPSSELLRIISNPPAGSESLLMQLVTLPPEKFQAALARILQGSAHTGPALTPAEVLIAIHGIDPERDAIPLKKVTDACTACFEQRDVFTQQVLAKVLNQLISDSNWYLLFVQVEQTPLPLLFMRTVIQAIGAFPSLVEFIMEILSRLVSKQIWRFPKLWVGFLKCAYQTKPHSFHVLLQLPAAQLENALNKNSVLRAPLITHANNPNIRSTLPRSTLA
ncbi:hypothetical protein KI387_042014, partial [Taxus chinensis]